MTSSARPGPADRHAGGTGVVTAPPLSPRVDAALDGLGLTSPLRRDGALAALVAALSALAALLPAVVEPTLAVEPFPGTAVLLLVVQAVLLTGRRVAPQLCLAAVVGLAVLTPFLLSPGEMVRGPATTIAVYTCATLLPPRRVVVLVAASVGAECAAIVAATVVGAGPVVGAPVAVVVVQLVSVLLLHAAAALVGLHIATRRRYVEMAGTRAAAEIETHRVRADAAVMRERARMARELHDIAAHHLSAMVVQAAMIEKLVDRDPERAKRTAAAARRQGRETLRDLRMVVGALRDDTPGAEDTGPDGDVPVPGLAELDRLVATHRELGAAVTVEDDGRPTGLAPVADVTGYRVAQEALANARDHAPGAPVRLVLDRAPDTLTLTVENPLPAGGPAPVRDGRGFGLAGMRERAQLVGAEFDSGPTAMGTWRVRLVLRATTDETEET